jgi:hypothetical protein
MSAMQKGDSLTLPAYKVVGEIDHYGFDDSADEGGIWRIGQLPTLTGSMTVDIDFFASATTGNVQFGVQALAYTVGTDATAITTAAFATAVLSTATTVDGTTLVPVRATVTLATGAQQDSAATGDYFILKIYRDVSGDTLSGDAEVCAVHLSYAAS